MKYDLSKVPRPLHSKRLRVYTRPSVNAWEVMVGNDDFQVIVATVSDYYIEAAKIRDEIISVLQAHRLLAGKQISTQLFTTL